MAPTTSQRQLLRREAGRGAGYNRGGLRGCRGMPGRDGRRVGATGRVERRGRAAEKSAEAVVPAGIVSREGPNVEPSGRTFVLVGAVMSAANPVRGLGGKAIG